MDLVVAGLLLTWVVLGIVCALTYHLVKQYGRVLLEVESLRQQLGEPATTIGEPGPALSILAPPIDGEAEDYAAQLERRANQRGLPIGTPAPAFKLPRLGGGELALDELRGRRVLLVFSDPQCGACETLLPRLEQLHRQHSPQLNVLMVSRGDPHANRTRVDRHGLTFPVGLQRHWEISRQYGLLATPVGYLVDERSVIASEAAVGAEAILALAAAHAPS